MITIGVDLAAEPKRTGLAVLEWENGGARLLSLQLAATDAMIVGLARGADKIGIDCPFGWPDAFVEFLVARRSFQPFDRGLGEGIVWRNQLAYRETDREVHAATGRWPLSVSTDRLGRTAMRCAALLDALASSGVLVDRRGVGHVVEVYPAAALRRWGFVSDGYKSSEATRERLLAGLLRAMPWLDLGDHDGLVRSSEDAMDAVLAALIARASAVGGCAAVPSGLEVQASREGWIALPTLELADLANEVG